MNKKLSEFSMKEIRTLILTLTSQLQKIMNDDDTKKVLQALADARKGIKTELTNTDAIFIITNNLLITNEKALWTILAAFTQSTIEKVQEMNNIEVLQTVTDFLSIEAYKKLFLQAIK